MNGAGPIIAAWRDHLTHGQRRSPHTVRAYVSAAEQLAAAHGLADWNDAARIEAHALRAHLARRRAEGLGNASAARELSALKAFIAFARNQTGDPEPAPPRLRGPRLKKGLPRPVTPDEASNLAELVDGLASSAWIGARDRAVLLLMYGAGLRIAEALSLKGRDVPLGEVLTVTGKGGKQRIVPVLPVVRAGVADYAAACPWPLAP
ncbi:MAG: site-specific integrase, partial [Porphyrobacter sp.]|nr:site-specific integrase [Porphyrobacter sp.]